MSVSGPAASGPNAGGTDAEALRAELTATQAQLARLMERQQRLAELLNCPPDKIEHEIRNLLNEIMLLRKVFETTEKK